MTRNLELLALVTDAFGGRGGIAQYNRDFLGALAATGVTSSITVLPRHAPDPAVVPPGIRQSPPRAGWIRYALAALYRLDRRIDVVFCGHLYMTPLAVMVARLHNAKLIVQMHGVEAWVRPTQLRRAAVEAADLVLCVSRYTRARVLSWATTAPERVLVLPNTVGECFTPGNGSALRDAWGLGKKYVLLSVGRMDSHERYKGHDRMIGVIPQLVAAGHDVVYVVLGDGDDLPRLQAMASEAGVADRVRFMGAAGVETLVDAYRLADLFVMPSTGEGFGIAFLEAMASGTPAIGLAVAGATDALADGELGLAVPEQAFAAELAYALDARKPKSSTLASAVRARFGREPFVAGARAALEGLMETA